LNDDFITASKEAVQIRCKFTGIKELAKVICENVASDDYEKHFLTKAMIRVLISFYDLESEKPYVSVGDGFPLRFEVRQNLSKPSAYER